MKREPMELQRMRPFLHSMSMGMLVGAIGVLGLVTWRTIATDSVRDSLIAFAIAAPVSAALLAPAFTWLWRRTLRKAKRDLPEGAKIERKRHGMRWLAALTGLGGAFAAVRRSWDEPVWGAVAAGVVVGIMLGALYASRRLAKWEDEQGAELLRGQQGMHARFFVREQPADREPVT